MIKAKVNAAVVALVLTFGAAGAVNAITIQSGDFKMTLDNYDSATTNDGVGADVKCTTVLGCDGAAVSPALGSSGSDITFGAGVTATKNLNAAMYPRISDGTAVLALNALAAANGWTLLSTGDITESVPESGSLALALMGAGVVLRCHKA